MVLRTVQLLCELLINETEVHYVENTRSSVGFTGGGESASSLIILGDNFIPKDPAFREVSSALNKKIICNSFGFVKKDLIILKKLAEEQKILKGYFCWERFL